MKGFERLSFDADNKYNATEASIHINRYLAAKDYVVNKKVLDIACGEGYGSYLLMKWGAAKVVGVDISEEAINSANSNFSDEKIDFICRDITENISDISEGELFDTIVSFETVEHLHDISVFMQNIVSLIKKDGVILMSCPNDHAYYSEEESNPYHIKKYTFDEFKSCAEKYFGTKNVMWYFGTWSAGFANIPMALYKGSQVDSQISMIDYNETSQSIIVPTEQCISQDNAAYYLGIWNASGRQNISMTGYSTSEKDNIKIWSKYNALLKEKDKKDIENVELWDKYNNLLNEKDKKDIENAEIWDKYNTLLNEKETKDMENAEIWDKYNTLANEKKAKDMENNELWISYNALLKDRDAKAAENNELWNRYNNILKERDSKQTENIELWNKIDNILKDRDEKVVQNNELWEKYNLCLDEKDIVIKENDELYKKIEEMNNKYIKLTEDIKIENEKLNSAIEKITEDSILLRHTTLKFETVKNEVSFYKNRITNINDDLNEKDLNRVGLERQISELNEAINILRIRNNELENRLIEYIAQIEKYDRLKAVCMSRKWLLKRVVQHTLKGGDIGYE